MTDVTRWIGNQQTREGVIDEHHANLISVTLNASAPAKGESLPPCWHWAWFNDAMPSSELGRDGHPAKGGFIPPLPLPRRMWAGGDITFHRPIVIGRHIRKISTIEKIDEKSGSSGQLFIVSIRHQLFDGEELCIDETQNLVYRDDPDPNAPQQQYTTAAQNAETSIKLVPDSTLMFRYSALTFNGHRIHYDADYARDVEGYPGLVFHAPLSATMLCGLGDELLGDVPLKRFRYRATAPVFCGEPIRICGRKTPGAAELWIEKADRIQAMTAVAEG